MAAVTSRRGSSQLAALLLLAVRTAAWDLLPPQPQCGFTPRPEPAQWDCEAVAEAVGQPLQDWTAQQAGAFAVAHAPIICA